MASRIFILAALALCCIALSVSHTSESNVAGLFPDIEGWTKDGSPEIYYAENLWEYINGAAEVYLSYDFQKVATLTYESGEKRSLTIDVYEHSDPRNAFGIYSQEKPSEGNFLPIGTQAYYDKGILNFFMGSYYVKLMGFYLDAGEKPFLASVAEQVSKELKGEKAFPKTLRCFPEKGMIKNSERFIAEDFLGHSYLHSAFTANYEVDGKKINVFIIEAANQDQSKQMLEKYLNFAKEKGSEVCDKRGFYRFDDPYMSSSGRLNLKQRDNYIWGLFCDNAPKADFYIETIEKNLVSSKLLK
ncbi:MAG: hypothetical protein GTO42_08605 [Candidatus Latescibacteria bacterium]|nr:hypothetical protein [Candidatus Latescibacterota bacterium]NIO29020.1 hypothetical protein [Candidatus Latescibacterota bacterium]NIO56645.1 hypothetical protein [Candidatus Latescibacterota bacterium]NIT02228.1 hypothetical protein [Candidatus Latescibacterota bacterium]NIT39113.1 hypothetical protein [Candidatus Latescibacterota bacterium]